MKATQLEDEFAPFAIRADADLRLLEPTVALRLIGRASEEGVPILGVDGYVLAGLSTDAPLEHTVDFSDDVDEGHGCWDKADAFIRQREALGLVFEVLLGDDPVEAV